MLTGQKTDAPGNVRDEEAAGAHIVNLDVVVVSFAGGLNAFFGVGKLNPKSNEVFVGIQFRAARRGDEQSAECDRQGFFGFSPRRGRRGGGKFAAGIGDACENFFLIRRMVSC